MPSSRAVEARVRVAALTLLAVALSAGVAVGPAVAAGDARAAPTLSVWRGGAWQAWWSADQAPDHWSQADTSLSGALEWQRLAPGLEWASLRLACPAPTWRARLIVARIDPREVALSIETGWTRDKHPAWTIDRAPRDAILAVNAGQFTGGMPWGWVASQGRQLLRPGPGPLASAITIDPAGRVRWTHGDSLLSANGTVLGFQSYPTLLSNDGVVPPPLRASGSGVSKAHRDARLALGETRDGRLLVVLTRFDAMGELAGGVPLGPTTPEMAAIMGALGARDAMMLDGGISAQLLLRDSRNKTLRWPGMRKVPLALIARARARARS